MDYCVCVSKMACVGPHAGSLVQLTSWTRGLVQESDCMQTYESCFTSNLLSISLLLSDWQIPVARLQIGGGKGKKRTKEMEKSSSTKYWSEPLQEWKWYVSPGFIGEKVMSNLHQSLIVLDLFVPLVLVRGHVGQHTPNTHLGKEKRHFLYKKL